MVKTRDVPVKRRVKQESREETAQDEPAKKIEGCKAVQKTEDLKALHDQLKRMIDTIEKDSSRFEQAKSDAFEVAKESIRHLQIEVDRLQLVQTTTIDHLKEENKKLKDENTALIDREAKITSAASLLASVYRKDKPVAEKVEVSPREVSNEG